MDYASEDVSLFPDGPSLPKFGTQRGSLLLRQGDPLTPGIPAIGEYHYCRNCASFTGISLSVSVYTYMYVHTHSQRECIDVITVKHRMKKVFLKFLFNLFPMVMQNTS